MHTRKILLAALLLLLSFSSFGQFGGRAHYYRSKSYYEYGQTGRKHLKRFYMSFNLPMMNYNLATTLKVNRNIKNPYDNKPGQSIDTSISISTKASGSFGYSSGSFFPISRFGNDQMIAIDWGVGFYWYSFRIGEVKYSPEIIVNKNSQFIISEIPIALVYKTGGEVNQDRKKNPLLSLGAGFSPTLIAGGYESAASITAKMRTFVMAEIGAHFGIAAKFRVTYYPGDLELLNDETEGLTIPNSHGSFTAHGVGSGGCVLSLILLPHSPKWGDNGYNYNNRRRRY